MGVACCVLVLVARDNTQHAIPFFTILKMNVLIYNIV